MSKFHEDREKKCLLDCSHKTAPLPGGHVFSLITTIFKLIRDIHITNEKDPPPGSHVFLPIQTIIKLNCPIQPLRKNAPPLGSHVFQAKVTIFELIQDIIGTNHLWKFQEDLKINVAPRVLTRKNAPPPDGHVV
ncbi:hypothetical protein DPMN_069293 [Dreissena polymorpha]|uniref:Uncharacterized protein n=1 Tax=Dreissena polymorpha TaxID=45954 RepID=A0A9D3YZ75_DREPO|nr:hypothetical protein DPMN_069293 [Dreissena polymorpha]